MKNYKYELQKGSKHILCPNCQKKTFKPYVNAQTKEIVDAMQFGRCERIQSCAFMQYPNIEDSDWKEFEPPRIPYRKPKPDFVPVELVEATFNSFHQNVFFKWLVKMFDSETALQLQSDYNIGTAKNGGTIYWQQDKDGNFRTGKVMYYGENGKRKKDKNSWYVHNRVKKDFELVQCFFGEHLIKENPNKPVALCESEKSAVVMSVLQPEYTWIAAGGANMLNTSRLMRLARLDLVSADQGQFNIWESQTSFLKDRQMDVRVENAYSDGLIKQGDDILDLYLSKEMKQTVLS